MLSVKQAKYAAASTPNRMIAQPHTINEALNVLLGGPRRSWGNGLDDSFDNFIYLNITLPCHFGTNSPDYRIGKEAPTWTFSAGGVGDHSADVAPE